MPNKVLKGYFEIYGVLIPDMKKSVVRKGIELFTHTQAY